MDGSVSTLAPIFAAAFATQDTWQTFLVGLSASVGAGISMGFTEAAHDDGKLSGRGSPLKRGLANGIMTALGGLGHTLPYLIPRFLDGDVGRRRHRVRRIVGDRLHPEPLHGDAVPARGLPGGARRRAGVCGRRADRQRVGAIPPLREMFGSSSADFIVRRRAPPGCRPALRRARSCRSRAPHGRCADDSRQRSRRGRPSAPADAPPCCARP